MTDAEKLAEVTAQRDKALAEAVERGWTILDLQAELAKARGYSIPSGAEWRKALGGGLGDEQLLSRQLNRCSSCGGEVGGMNKPCRCLR